MIYDPYLDLAERHPHISVDDTRQLDHRGEWIGNTIYLDASLSDNERRSTLAHEIQHLDRGHPDPGFEDDEEIIVDDLATRRLIGIEDMGGAIGEVVGAVFGSIAADLRVDVASLATRSNNLSASEMTQLCRVVLSTALGNADAMDNVFTLGA